MLNALEYKSCFTLKCHITNKINFMLTLERKQKYKHATVVIHKKDEKDRPANIFMTTSNQAFYWKTFKK